MKTAKRYSTKKEILESLKISDGTLQKLIKSGRIKAIKLNRRIIFDPDDLFGERIAIAPAPIK